MSPRRNRVTPSGEIVAVHARGTVMGNRGNLHSPDGRIVRTHCSAAWLVCLLKFSGRRRRVMQPGLYTELFFLDEATALAAGHRPCFECRRADAVAFARALTRRERPLAAYVDDALHPFRLPVGAGRPTWRAAARDLPDASMVLVDDEPHLLVGGAALRWAPEGYASVAVAPRGRVDVLTPRPTVAALTRGYRAGLHPTARR